jgi:hypothetical protein
MTRLLPLLLSILADRGAIYCPYCKRRFWVTHGAAAASPDPIVIVEDHPQGTTADG